MPDFAAIDRYLEENMDASLEELCRLCAQPSISAQKLGLEECAQLTGELLAKRGFTVEIMPTGGAPAVYAERRGRSNKTLMFYNHYDVQPPEPLELWESPPFEPSLRDGKLYARGVSDDKGHITSRLHAIDAILSEDGELPCNIKFLVEGEEEAGSVSLEHFVREHAKKFAADACIWEFGGVDFQEAPVQYLGLRGICYVELTVQTAEHDVHSGIGGSIFPNAAWRLVWALASLKGPDEVIRIPGHYNTVIPPTPRDIELMAALPPVEEDYQQRYGVKHFLKGLTGGVELKVAEVFEPTCTICGLTSGYQGEGSKTVLPARASAKIDFRLALGQTPEQVLTGLRRHLDEQGFSDVQITNLGGDAPARTDPEDPFVQMVVRAANEVYDRPMEIVPMTGGSGPNYAFIHYLKVPVATSGIGYPGAQTHAPNENIRLDLYLKGAQHIARIIKYF
jgi:acetylornithine deacetylase/succinyl-diaminopimelate desuccinylase-like protein